MGNFELTCMYFGLWEEARAPGGKTHLDTRRTLKLCDERPQPTGRFQTQYPPAVRRQRLSLHRRMSHFIDLEITAVKHEACQWWQSICLDCCFFLKCHLESYTCFDTCPKAEYLWKYISGCLFMDKEIDISIDTSFLHFHAPSLLLLMTAQNWNKQKKSPFIAHI